MVKVPRLLTFALVGLPVLLGLYWALIYFVQRSMLFPAPPLSGMPARPADAQEIWFEVGGVRTEAWYLPARSSAPAPLLIYTPAMAS
jgi:hypothetical protein